MTELLGARRLRALLTEHGVRPVKSLGQNFIIDPNTIRKIVAVSGIGPQDRVLEIGAGAGSLTLGLAEIAQGVVAVEVDVRLEPVLRAALAGVSNVELLLADARKLPLSHLDVTRAAGNLPYYAAAQITVHVLQHAPQITDMTVMTQKEVGERLAAAPGSKTYGLTSVLVAYHAAAEVAARISRQAFYPVPNVDSVLVRIRRRPPPEAEAQRFGTVVRTAFAHRRKTLRAALAPLLDEGSIRAAGIDPAARAEQLDLQGFAALARAVQ